MLSITTDVYGMAHSASVCHTGLRPAQQLWNKDGTDIMAAHVTKYI